MTRKKFIELIDDYEWAVLSVEELVPDRLEDFVPDARMEKIDKAEATKLRIKKKLIRAFMTGVTPKKEKNGYSIARRSVDRNGGEG